MEIACFVNRAKNNAAKPRRQRENTMMCESKVATFDCAIARGCEKWEEEFAETSR